MGNSIFLIISLAIFLICPVKSFAFQNVMIQNHSFSVITEDMVKLDDEDEEGRVIKIIRTALFIQNDDCNIKYKAMFGKAILGEGETKLEVFPQVIQLGSNTLKIRCLAPNQDISVEEVK